jgi:hypothetical protein
MRTHTKSLLRAPYAIALRLAQADIVFWLLPALMVLLVAGTLAQVPMGFYAAHKMFFASFIIWAGPVPLPGGYLMTGALTICLLLKFVLQSRWSLQKSGIILTHLGVLVLLGGGLLTALSAKEGYMALTHGAVSPYIYDYNRRELVLYTADNHVRSRGFDNIRAGENLSFKNIPFTLRVLDACKNCTIARRGESTQGADLPLRGMARFMELTAKPPEKEPELNFSGLTFAIDHAGGDQDGLYIAFEAMPRPIELTVKDKTYRLIFGKQQRALPFAVRLENFTKDLYPGTAMARGYSSDITVIDGALEWPARIEMNTPLRYKGYTLYQSSFEETEDGAVSILTVTRNSGRLFPYLGTALLALGLLLHIGLTLAGRRTV